MALDCFLCCPDEALVVERQTNTFMMVGLGPITRTYGLLAAKTHIRSMADLWLESSAAITELQDARVALERVSGPLLMSEHGRVPVCRDSGDDHDQHCFHAHNLLFASEADIVGPASSYYGERAVFTDLCSALAHAATKDHYLLISPNTAQYVILSEPLNAPRQLTRTLVAIGEGVEHLADWRDCPQTEAAAAMANRLRNELAR